MRRTCYSPSCEKSRDGLQSTRDGTMHWPGYLNEGSNYSEQMRVKAVLGGGTKMTQDEWKGAHKIKWLNRYLKNLSEVQ